MKAARSREDGFTVLEVVVAVLLLSVGLLATAQLAMFATTQSALGTQASSASTLASQTIESYRDANFATIGAGTVVTTSTVGGTLYTITSIITNNDPAANMTRVHVTVSWAGGGQSYVTETVLSPLE
jgi:prepilin-type N-terminal cleavage/methylation domain-containing protein